MLYFLATTPLTLVQVGAALTTAGLLALPAGPLVGGLVDRYGAKPVLQVANLAQALGFAGYLVVGADHPDTLASHAELAQARAAVGGQRSVR
ncbi:hypothetical protein OHA25_13375 [Nonomuraea sp. NBC_00507]|uniref:hypothetical protein n=1 Tax=Nonomuraea sp. NBC_00507 TaxID=2976002 RepID=UPI002E18A282